MGVFMEEKEIQIEDVEEKKETKGKFKIQAIILLSLTIIFIIATFIFFIYNDTNSYVIRINGENVSMSEFETYLKWQMQYMQETSAEEIVWTDIDEESGVPYIDLAKDLTVELLTETKVELQEAKKRNITLTDEEKDYIRSAVKDALAENEGLKKYDLTEDEWIEINQNDQIISKLIFEVCNEEFTPYDSRHILLIFPDNATQKQKEEVRTKAQGLLDRVLSGEDFAKLAQEYSEDEGSKNNGGLYEGTAKGDFVVEYEEAALSLKDGEIYPELVES